MISQEKTEEHPFADIFSEDENENNFLLSKPVCFVIFGKPVQSLLISGQSVPDELVTKLMIEKLNSLEVSHFGYIITEIPSLSQDSMTTLQQIELIKNLNLKPDVIINIKCPDYDLCRRISGQRQHSSTGYVYARNQWDPEVIESRRKKKKEAQKEGKGEEEGEEEEEQEEEEAFIAGMQMVAEILQHLVQRPEDYLENVENTVKLYNEIVLQCLEAFIAGMQMVAEILQHLVQRPEDYLENVENTVKLYNEIVLQCLEEIMAEHDPQYLIELNGNKTPEELFMIVMERLKYLNLRRAAILTKLQSAEEEINDIMENEELFHTLSSYKLIAPRYRWQRSKWGRTCPVTLKEGNIYSGLPDFSVSFLGRMYCLSSEEVFKTFLLNPRPYLLPPMPAPPCKVFVFGPDCSGKTTLCNMLAENYQGKVIDYAKLVQPQFDKAREALIENAIAETTETAIKVVKEKLLRELQAKKQAEITLRELQRQYERKEDEEFPMKTFRSLEEDFATEEEVYRPESKRNSSLGDTEEAKPKSENVLYDQAAKVNKDGVNNVLYTDENEISGPSTSKRSSEDPGQELKTDADKVEDSIEEVTATHPQVLSLIEDNIKVIKEMNFEHPYEKHAEILEKVLREVTEENKDRFPNSPRYGGWIVDNCPIIKELWTVLNDKGIIPDLVICLSDTENNGKWLLNRLYFKNKHEIDSKILERLRDDLQKRKKEEEAAREAKEEALRIEEENKRLMEAINKKTKEAEDADEGEDELEGEESEFHELEGLDAASEEIRGSLLPEEFEVPDIPETEPELAPEPTDDTSVETENPKEPKEGLETEELYETVVLPEFAEDAYPDVPEMDPLKEKINYFNIMWKQLEIIMSDSFLQILNLEIANKTPKELLQKVVDTMEKPFQYTAWEFSIEDYDEETEDYQAELEADEEIEEEEEEEEEGNIEEAAKYREKIYYFSSTEAKEKFLEHPEDYVAHEEPLKFEEVLQEKLLLKIEKRVGPELEEDSEEEQIAKQELEELAIQANVKIEEENTKKQTAREDEEISDDEPEEDEDDIENILEEEFPKDEEEMSEEDEEQEMEAIERLRAELGEKFEADMSNLQSVQDELEKVLIPVIVINGARKVHIVQYILSTKLKPLVENRESLFEKCYPISALLAQKMLTYTYKYISAFGYWDPVKLSEGETIKPVENSENPVYPVIHRQYIYFLSSKRTKEKFMKNPIKYIRQPKPKPTVPIRITIVGPPKSGKTTVARKIASEYGLKRLSIGDALRSVLNNHPETELALMLNWHLHKGMTAPNELAIQALELSLMESACSTAGVVIDGYPVTTLQMNLLEARSIIPMIIFELDVPSKETFKRLLLEKSEQSLPYPLHNSAQIVAVKNAKYHKNIGDIRKYYQEQHQNWYVIDGFHSKWWVWNEVMKNIQMINKYMQTYLERIKAGKAARIDMLCITPQELISRLGEFGQYCPVSLAETNELFDCSGTDSLEFAAEFRGHYYKMYSQEKLNVTAEILGSEASTQTSPVKGTNISHEPAFARISGTAFNPKGSEYTRKKYKKKMDQFVERCELITYLGAKMTRKYQEPQFRAIDFDYKLQSFLSLRDIDPING
ncbi:Adenylate kinase domain-containing protein 1 [Tupaia chinensis]|uniref:Adenylate kinase 9 n=1 Tax=Tupaia chinensis TaxID=246437 RepID=L9JLQ2_TUPCH|nr:Adenylate kinase domain-containing protein 1 [Tupaia chinensis]